MRRHGSALIDRPNWKVTREYLRYCGEVRQCCDGSVDMYRQALDLLLRWARDVPLCDCAGLRPVFPRFLVERELSEAYQKKVCAISRAFYRWALTRWPRKYRGASLEWVESLKPSRRMQVVCQRELYEIDEVRRLVATPAERLVERRDRACVAFLFLSAMRDGAFCSLPVKAVKLDPPPGMVKQWPALGVRTKNRKAANTYLLNVPDLLEVVRDWDARVRREVGEDGLWFARLECGGIRFAKDQVPGVHRTFGRRLRLLCERAGMSYRSPHKFRHGHAVWALRQAGGMADLKAISQNLMHASVTTTERIYARLLGNEVRDRITALQEAVEADPSPDVAALAEQLFRMLQAG